MHIIPEWDGIWVRQKVACFRVWGQKTLYPVVRTRFSVVFGNAFFDSTDGGCLTYYYKKKRRFSIRLERANAGARKGRADDTWSEFQNRQPIS